MHGGAARRQVIHRQTHQILFGITQQFQRRGIRQANNPLEVDQEESVRVCEKE